MEKANFFQAESEHIEKLEVLQDRIKALISADKIVTRSVKTSIYDIFQSYQ